MVDVSFDADDAVLIDRVREEMGSPNYDVVIRELALKAAREALAFASPLAATVMAIMLVLVMFGGIIA